MHAIANFTEQDFRDLQIWFNLAWIDPDELAKEPLKSLIEKGSWIFRGRQNCPL